MSKFIEKVTNSLLISAAIGPSTSIAIIIIFIGIVKGCTTETPDPIDNSINKSQKIVQLLRVVDCNGNGFRVHYVTTHAVTEDRYDEICLRQNLKDAFRNLQQDAPLHFGGSLLQTDIYDFADFAKNYDVTSDVHIDCIFVTGPEKSDFYAQPNPNLPEGELWIDPRTEQGLQWINHRDIYSCMDKGARIYRYWKCSGIREISLTDERFTHYTTQERVH